MIATLNRQGPKRGPKRQDDLYNRLEKLKPKQEVVINTEQERNRALKYARTHRMFLITRTKFDGKILVWRAS